MRAYVLLPVALAMIAVQASAQALLLDETEIRQVLRHGPWPPAFAPDPSNRASGNPEAIALGAALFEDPALSADGQMSCATCHDPAADFTDGLARAEGRVRLDRNTQALWNLSGHRWFGWAGDTDNLWAQSLTPILNPDEMAHTPLSLQAALQDSSRRAAYEAVFGPIADETPIDTSINISKSLAAYLETLISGETSFDRFRNALAEEDYDAAATYPEAAQRGLQIFLGEGQCSVCHSGPNFTNGEFHDAGVPYFVEPGRVDPGRQGGVQAVLDSPFTLAGAYSDDPDRTGAWAVETVRPLHSDFGTFRVPLLRRVAQTAPYMHDGSLSDLSAVLEHYNTIDMERLHTDGEAILRPLGLAPDKLADLEAFLESLSDDVPSVSD